jgi:hypothetical protein
MRWPWQIWREHKKAQQQAAINTALLKLPEVVEAVNKAYERHWVQMGTLLNNHPDSPIITGLRAGE